MEEVGTPASRLAIGKACADNFAHAVPWRCGFVIIGRGMEEAVMLALLDVSGAKA